MSLSGTTSSAVNLINSSGTAATVYGAITLTSGSGASNELSAPNGDSLVVNGNIVNSSSSNPSVLVIGDSTNTGTVTLSGANTYSGGTTVSGGILKFGNAYVTTTSAVTSSPIGTGNITINAGATLDLNGYNFGTSTQTSNVPSITMAGTGTGTSQASLINSATAASGSVIEYGAINLTKIAGVAGTLVDYIGQITNSNSNALTIAGIIADGTGSNAAGVQVGGTGYLGTVIFKGANSYSGGTTVSAGTLIVSNNSALGVGALAMSGATTLQAGATAVSLSNPITLSGAATINAPNGDTFTLSGKVTDNSYGVVVSGAGNISLTNSLNSISALASSGTVGALAVTDSAALALGSITIGGSTYSGLATASMDIETTTGNITIANNLSATSTSATAIVINAGNTLLQGATSTGSDILISGTPTITVGSGGRATLYTGTISGSGTFTTALVANGNYRYNSTKSTAGYSATLGSGVYAVYRQQPTLTVTANNVNMTYGASSLPTISAAYSGLINGDAASSITVGTVSSTAPVYSAGVSATGNAGLTYTIAPTGYTNSLGYAISNVAGVLTMVAAPLTITATATNMTYGATSLPSLAYTYSA
ncbi:autotransporter-associated beta strand protein, partial [Polynucleobacter sphagniphilus]|nr:autotransporter-associated beta strand protein [Polynucleobacter sphagniphilus]